MITVTEPLVIRPLTVEVTSARDPGCTYTVTLPHCTCPDFRYRRGGLGSPFCKHLRAVLAALDADRDRAA